MSYRKIASLKTPQAFLDHLKQIEAEIPFDVQVSSAPQSPLAQPLAVDGLTIGNRFAVLPMEGWDGTLDGHPTDLTFRRWQRFGLSGAKLIWGGEAAAIRPDGRANPNQLLIGPGTLDDLARLRQSLVESHRSTHGRTDDLVVGLQLTHSGRFCRPNASQKLEPRLAYDHPTLNRRCGLPAVSGRVLSDDELDGLVGDFVQAARLAQEAGFQFVDVKQCHGYLGHELLSAVNRPGKYGGSFENRTRFVREIVQGIKSELPGLKIGVRLSAFDFMPFRPGTNGVGEPELEGWPDGYPYAFGGDGTGLGIDLAEPIALIRMLNSLGVYLFCISGGSPYYNPHLQRPAYYPPSDGYLPPEDPLLGIARQMRVTAQLKAQCPGAVFVGSAYSGLQDWLPNVAQAAVRTGVTDFVGLGRMMLSYPQMPADILAGRPLQRRQICRTLSDCTTAPRNGLVSGCFRLDPFYKHRPEAAQLDAIRKGL